MVAAPFDPAEMSKRRAKVVGTLPYQGDPMESPRCRTRPMLHQSGDGGRAPSRSDPPCFRIQGGLLEDRPFWTIGYQMRIKPNDWHRPATWTPTRLRWHFHRPSALWNIMRSIYLVSSVFLLWMTANGAERPNIVFIMTDQHRWDCIGANGNQLIKTPNLDRLASQGANLTHFFVQSPVCVPSRGSFFTGRYPHSHRNRVNYTPLDRDEVLMQRRLRDAGYATASVGKLHYHPPTKMEAKRTGFDFVELHDAVPALDRFSDYIAWLEGKDTKAANHHRALAKDIPAGKNPFRQAIDERYSETTWTGERTRHHIRELAHSDKPFFLFSSFWKPHSPFEVPQPFDAMYDDVMIPLPEQMTLEQIEKLPTPLRTLILRFRPSYDTDRERLQWMYRSYYGAISHIDREVGLILEELDSVGVSDNTIVVFSSDHGDQLLEHGLMGKNCFFEASVRVPCIIRFPQKVRSATYDELVESVDLLPTLFELAGIPEPYTSQGRSLAGLITTSGGGVRSP